MTKVGKQDMAHESRSSMAFCVGKCTGSVQPRDLLCISAKIVATCPRAKRSVATERAPEKSDASTQTDLLKKETSIQGIGCSKHPGLSSGEKVSTYKRRVQIEDLLCQVAVLQQTVERFHSITEAQTEIDKWFHYHVL